MTSKDLLISGVLAGGLAVFMFGDAFRRWLRLRAARSWMVARGRIIESCLYRDPEQDNAIHFRVIYRFETSSGEEIEGNTPRLCGDWFWSDRAQQEFVAQFLPGDEVDVYFDPVAPHLNCLDREDSSSFLVELCVGLIVVPLVWAVVCAELFASDR